MPYEFHESTTRPEHQLARAVSPAEMGSVALHEVLREKPENKFVFSHHTLENAPAVAEAVQDCDVIAMELISGADDADRQRSSRMYTQILSSSTPESKRAEALRMLENDTDKGYNWMGAVLKGLPLDSKIVLVDVNQSSPEYAMLEEESKLFQEFGSKLADGTTPNSRLAEMATEYLTLAAESNKQREEHVVDQLHDIQRTYAGKKVGVVLGAVHTPVQHQLEAEGEKTSRTFVDPGGHDSEKAHYSYEEQIQRQLRIRPETKPDGSLLDRVLLSSMYLVYLAEGKAAAREHVENEIVGKMTDQEVEQLLQKVDDIKAGGKKRSVFKAPPNTKIRKLLDESRK